MPECLFRQRASRVKTMKKENKYNIDVLMSRYRQPPQTVKRTCFLFVLREIRGLKRETEPNVVSNAIRISLDERWICLLDFPVNRWGDAMVGMA